MSSKDFVSKLPGLVGFVVSKLQKHPGLAGIAARQAAKNVPRQSIANKVVLGFNRTLQGRGSVSALASKTLLGRAPSALMKASETFHSKSIAGQVRDSIIVKPSDQSNVNSGRFGRSQGTQSQENPKDSRSMESPKFESLTSKALNRYFKEPRHDQASPNRQSLSSLASKTYDYTKILGKSPNENLDKEVKKYLG